MANSLLEGSICDLTVEDIKAYAESRRNDKEMNHRQGDDGYLDILARGGEELKKIYGDTPIYSFNRRN
jgi:hypothetical protein